MICLKCESETRIVWNTMCKDCYDDFMVRAIRNEPNFEYDCYRLVVRPTDAPLYLATEEEVLDFIEECPEATTYPCFLDIECVYIGMLKKRLMYSKYLEGLLSPRNYLG